MAMLRRLHALGPKSGSDQAAQLLRSLSSRGSTPALQGSESRESRDSSPIKSKDRDFGAIGPVSSRRTFNSPNRGLFGLSGACEWTGSIGANTGGARVAMRTLTGGAEPSSQG